MSKRERSSRVHLVVLALAFLGLACGPCSLLSREVPTPPHRIVVSTESATQLRSRIEQSLSGPPGQQFILRMTDAEFTSLLTTELAKYDESPVAEPSVWFTKGKIYATGRLTNVVPISAAFYLIASAHIEEGRVVFEIEDFSAGALPVPRRALDMLSQSLNETLDELQLEVEITALEILEGEAIFEGVRKETHHGPT